MAAQYHTPSDRRRVLGAVGSGGRLRSWWRAPRRPGVGGACAASTAATPHPPR
jgi:hypothetical protein